MTLRQIVHSQMFLFHSAAESFQGKMTRLDVWKRILNSEEINILKKQCEPYFGDVIAWPDVHNGLRGQIQVLI